MLIQANGDMSTAGNDISDFAAVNAGDSSANEAARRQSAAGALARGQDAAGGRGERAGVGTTMLMHCDLVYVARNAADHAVREPGPGGWRRLQHHPAEPDRSCAGVLDVRAGQRRWMRRRRSTGIANEVTPLSELRARRAAAEAVAARPPAAVAITKALMRDEAGPAGRMDESASTSPPSSGALAPARAFAAFAEKRAPDFSRSTHDSSSLRFHLARVVAGDHDPRAATSSSPAGPAASATRPPRPWPRRGRT